MRKAFIRFLLFSLLLGLPATTKAQATLTLETLDIQLWPDYDRAAVLVIYDFTLTTDTALPATLNFRLPSDANLQAVAKDSNNGLITIEYQPLTLEGGYNLVTFTVTEPVAYHLEYYLPYTRDAITRNFVFTWPGDYAIKSLTVLLQEPTGAKKITTEPILSDASPEPDGFIYRRSSLKDFAAEQIFTLKVSYQKSDDTLSASALGVQPSSPLNEDVVGQTSLTFYLPWILGALGFLLAGGGILWYWLSGQMGRNLSKSRKRRIARTGRRKDSANGDGQIYCHECGKRAQPGDQFCRTCGARLRQGEA